MTLHVVQDLTLGRPSREVDEAQVAALVMPSVHRRRASSKDVGWKGQSEAQSSASADWARPRRHRRHRRHPGRLVARDGRHFTAEVGQGAIVSSAPSDPSRVAELDLDRRLHALLDQGRRDRNEQSLLPLLSWANDTEPKNPRVCPRPPMLFHDHGDVVHGLVAHVGVCDRHGGPVRGRFCARRGRPRLSSDVQTPGRHHPRLVTTVVVVSRSSVGLDILERSVLEPKKHDGREEGEHSAKGRDPCREVPPPNGVHGQDHRRNLLPVRRPGGADATRLGPASACEPPLPRLARAPARGPEAPALQLPRPATHAVDDVLVEGVGKARLADWAAGAHGLGRRRGASQGDEELDLRVFAAGGFGHPLRRRDGRDRGCGRRTRSGRRRRVASRGGQGTESSATRHGWPSRASHDVGG